MLTTEELLREVAARLRLTRPLACVDLETTGRFAEVDRIVSIAVAKVSPTGETRVWSTLVNPGIPIPREASHGHGGTYEGHGITDERVKDAPTFAALAHGVAAGFEGCDLLGYNVDRFDRKVLRSEFERAGLADPLAGARVLDVFRLWQHVEPRTLAHAVTRFGAAYRNGDERRAHDATSDVADTLAVLVGQLDEYRATLHRTVDGLCAQINPRDPSWLDAEGKIVWREGEAVFAVTKNAGRTLRELAQADPRFLQWVVARDFSDEVKAICRDALAGRFPEPPPAITP